MVRYRPHGSLKRLRAQQCTAKGGATIIMYPSIANNDTLPQEEHQQSIRMLRWLRTLSIDCSDVSPNQRNAFLEETMTMQQRSVLPCAVQRVVVNGLYAHSSNLKLYIVSLRLLTVLDFRPSSNQFQVNEFVTDQFLCAVAAVHHSWLQRLYLPQWSQVSQSTLDCFTKLEELDVTYCQTFTNVDFCAATLRVTDH